MSAAVNKLKKSPLKSVSTPVTHKQKKERVAAVKNVQNESNVGERSNWSSSNWRKREREKVERKKVERKKERKRKSRKKERDKNDSKNEANNKHLKV